MILNGIGRIYSYDMLEANITVTLTAYDDEDVSGQNISIVGKSNSTFQTSFIYSGQPETIKVPINDTYTVSADAKDGYITPEPVEIVASEDRNVVLTYLLHE